MSASSIHLLIECESKGLLSKQAAAEVLDKRSDLIKAAMQRQAKKLVDAMLAVGETKEASFLGKAVDYLRPGKAIEKDKGMLAKIKSGGLTGGEGHHGWSDVGLNLTKMLGLAGLTAGATAGTGAILHHSRDKKLQKKIQESYSQMFTVEPHEGAKLKEIQEANPGRVERNFGLLAKFAPSLAAEPSVAAAWVRATSHQNQIGPADIRNLAETQRKIDEMHEGRHGGPGIAPLRVDALAQKAMGG